MQESMENQQYAGFWIRVGAALIDTAFLLAIILPVLYIIYGGSYFTLGKDKEIAGTWDVVMNYVFPFIVVVAFWLYKSATPGKIMTKLIIVDAETGEKPSTQQFIMRYIGYFVSIIPFCLGLFWVGIDKRKQGFHDKFAGTVVLKQAAEQAE